MVETPDRIPPIDNAHFSHRVESEVLRTFSGLMQKHFDRSGGQLLPLDIDPARHNAQRFAIVSGYRANAGPDVVDEMAPHAISNYSDVVGNLMTRKTNREAIDRTEEILGSKGNVWLVTGHEIITDPGIALVSLYRVLQERRAKFMSSIMISKGVSVAGFKFGENAVPAADALSLICDRLYLPIPDSTSVRRTSLRIIYNREVKHYNGSILRDIDRIHRQGGQLTVVAPTAAAAEPNTAGEMVMPPVKPNTAKLLTREDGMVLPVAVGQHPDKSWFMEFLGEPTSLNSEAEVHNMMGQIAARQSELSHKTFVYSGGQES